MKLKIYLLTTVITTLAVINTAQAVDKDSSRGLCAIYGGYDASEDFGDGIGRIPPENDVFGIERATINGAYRHHGGCWSISPDNHDYNYYCLVSFGDSDDILTGKANPNHFDVLIGHAGSDLLHGKSGDDILYGNWGGCSGTATAAKPEADQLYGGDGQDILFGDQGDDKLYGDVGNDYLIGGTGNDDLYGDTGNDHIFGDEGDDQIYGGTGSDYMKGEGGNDVFYGDSGADVIKGGEGIDHLTYAASTAAVTVNLTTGAGSGGDASGDTYTTLENITGSSYGDDITGDASANQIIGGDGSDTLRGDSSNDTLNGDAGDDSLMGGSGDDALDGGVGTGDLAIYSGNQADYDVIRNANNSYTIMDLRTSGVTDGTDILSNIELVQFADVGPGNIDDFVTQKLVVIVLPLNGYTVLPIWQ